MEVRYTQKGNLRVQPINDERGHPKAFAVLDKNGKELARFDTLGAAESFIVAATLERPKTWKPTLKEIEEVVRMRRRFFGG
jgi:hypothetical protein